MKSYERKEREGGGRQPTVEEKSHFHHWGLPRQVAVDTQQPFVEQKPAAPLQRILLRREEN